MYNKVNSELVDLLCNKFLQVALVAAAGFDLLFVKLFGLSGGLVTAFMIGQRMNNETDRELKAYCLAFDDDVGNASYLTTYRADVLLAYHLEVSFWL
ncbi:unnamed protein product [Amaranthus hypochondriacus]